MTTRWGLLLLTLMVATMSDVLGQTVTAHPLTVPLPHGRGSVGGVEKQQDQHAHPAHSAVPLQPFAQQVRRIESTLDYLGEPFSATERKQINDAISHPDGRTAVSELEKILDRRALAIVDINPESRVQVRQGPAPAELVEGGTRLFLVKIINAAGVTAPLVVESPNSGDVYLKSTNNPEPATKLTTQDVKERWAEISLYRQRPMRERLSGFPLEYQILQVYSRDSGHRSAQMGFNVGQGTQDIGFRNDVDILFKAEEAFPVKLRVRDEKGAPTIASFIIRDHLERIYPNPSKRLAPDFPFQSQVYRADNDIIRLPRGSYTVVCSRGPEYIAQTKELKVNGTNPSEISFNLQRWIDPSTKGWYSGDHHIHAAGCSHYENPTQGVQPEDIWRQIQGEALNVGSVLTWGPCYYHQKQFFSGKDHPLSQPNQIIHYDMEISGFPSSHAGHLVLLGLKEQDYPGTKRIEEWPTWDLPVLRWAKSQDAVVGFAHSGWGLEVKTSELPNYAMPGFDSIGANEYIVDVTHPNTVDFISAGDTPYVWELGIWYHTLNVGFRTRISGETDFPCIYDDQVGMGRSYAKVEGPLSYRGWIESIRDGRNYVSDGRSHLIDFSTNGHEVGTKGSELQVSTGSKLRVRVKAAAYLDTQSNQSLPKASPSFSDLRDAYYLEYRAHPITSETPYNQKPYWHLERARIGSSRQVTAELIVNGKSVDRRVVTADGTMQDLEFEYPIQQSSWVAVRILGSSHTNPIFILVDGKPIRASRRSAEWCLAAVNQCWTQKAPKISARELPEAKKAYDHARSVYEKLVAECTAQ